MRILNRTKQTIVAEQVRRAVTFGEKLVGLMHRKEVRPLLMKTRFGIHTYGMRFPIDVIVFNREGVVTMVQEEVRPRSFIFWKPNAMYVLELPQGYVRASRTALGDELAVIEEEGMVG